MITGSELIEKLYSEEYNENEERLYSTGNEELDDLLERAFSEGYEYAQREFSKKEKRHKVDLEDINSHRGLGRSLLFAPFSAGGSTLGGFISKKVANAYDREGKSDKEIRRRAEIAGALAGAGIGVAAGGVLGGSVKDALISSGLGAAGGFLGANKNIRTRLKKRREMEEKIENRD